MQLCFGRERILTNELAVSKKFLSNLSVVPSLHPVVIYQVQTYFLGQFTEMHQVVDVGVAAEGISLQKRIVMKAGQILEG